MIWMTGDAAADQLLETDDFALLLGMLLDQQVAMETAFVGPWKIRERLGSLDPAAIAAADPEEFAALCATPPAVHRYPRAMAERIQKVSNAVVHTYDGVTSRIWSDPHQGERPDGAAVLARLRALPGFGEQKAKIFLAMLGKIRGIEPPGWREASAPYGSQGSTLSIADVTDEASLLAVRATKQAAKAAAKAAKAAKATAGG